MERSPHRTLPVLLLIGLAACGSAGTVDRPAEPGQHDICAVCGMFVAAHPAWVAQVVFEDGSVAFFDGSKDLFKYLLARDRYLPDKRRMKVAAIYVTDYYELEPIEARSALFVIGSDVDGPMGHELVSLASMSAAREFQRDHGGARILRFEEVTPDLARGLN